MKQGNQFYLEFQIVDNDGIVLTNKNVEKVVFYIGNLKRIYTPESTEVTYDSEKQCYDIWLTESETMQFETVNVDARILFTTGEILGCYKTQLYFNEIMVKESILESEGE